MRHMLTLLDFSRDEIHRILELSGDLKAKTKSGERPPLMQGRVIGMLFEKPSLRTRVSFDALIGQLGGTSLFLGEDVGWRTREPLRDFMPILTGYLDVLVIRAKCHQDVADAIKYSHCPIINGLTDVSHPCQALADMLTIRENSSDLEQTKVAYLGDSNNVAYSLAVICSKLGVRLSIASPQEYQFEPQFVEQLNEQSGNKVIEQVADPLKAVEDAEFVYTDVWTSMGQEAENEKRLKDLADYQVTPEVMNAARSGAKLMHCLPARRGEEVAAEVIDSPSSIVIEQAENRLHAQKGLVVWLLNEAKRPAVVKT